jgi:hypothetical protein
MNHLISAKVWRTVGETHFNPVFSPTVTAGKAWTYGLV